MMNKFQYGDNVRIINKNLAGVIIAHPTEDTPFRVIQTTIGTEIEEVSNLELMPNEEY